MAALTRKTFKLFGGSGTLSNFGQFGSKEAGLPQTSMDPTIIQQLAAWLAGWSSAISGADKAPYLQDMNGVMYVFSYMTAYLYQMGIPEWDTGTTYYINSVVQANNGQWFKSLQDTNAGNAPPAGASNAFWQWINEPPPAVPLVGNALKANLVVTPNAGAPATKTDVSAALLSVQGVVLSSIAVTGDISASGANGLDTGAPANNTWYAAHVITNAAGTLTAFLYSLSPTAPTLPVGYTLFRRVGWVRRDGSGNLRQFTCTGNWTYYKAPSTSSSPTGTTSFAADLPPTSVLAQFFAAFQGTVGGAQNWGSLKFTTTGDAFAVDVVSSGTMTASVSRSSSVFQFRTNSSQQIDVSTDNLGSAPWTVSPLAYYDPV